MVVRTFAQDGKEVKFGQGNSATAIPLPDPRLCNLHLAVARVFTASGFAEVVDLIFRGGSEGDGTADLGHDLLHKLMMLSVGG